MSYFGIPRDVLGFFTSQSLSGSEFFQSPVLELSPRFSQVETHIISDVAGTWYATWFTDAGGTNIIRSLTGSYNPVRRFETFAAPAVAPYVQYSYLNGPTPQTKFYFDTKLSTKALNPQIINLETELQAPMTSLVSRALLAGKTDGNKYLNVPVTSEGHLEVAIHAPRLPFGSIHTEKLTPIFQTDAVYLLNEGQVAYGSSGTGIAEASQSMFTVSTGTQIYSQAYIQSRRRLRYRPGQGVVARFTALFDSPTSQSYQTAGVGHAEDGLFFAYKNEQFGIIYSSHGVRETRTLTLLSASATNQTIEVYLGGATSSVAVTDSNNILRTAYELSSATYAGWRTETTGSSVIFVADSVGAKSGTFGLSGSLVTGSFSYNLTGSATTEVFIPQSDWNGDRLDGTGNSGATLIPQLGNVYQIGIQYLGFGPLQFFVEVPFEENNPDFVRVHTIGYANENIRPSFGNPAFPFTMAAASAGSTSNLTVRCASFAGMIEGEKKLNGNRISFYNTKNSISTSDITAIFTIKNSYVFANRTNQSVANLLSFAYAIRLSQNAVGRFYLIRNGTLGGNPSFTRYGRQSSAVWDTAASTVSFTDPEAQLVLVIPFAESSNDFIDLLDDISLQPGESLTIGARLETGTATYVSATLNTREDQ